jgi:hypothetical protein
VGVRDVAALHPRLLIGVALAAGVMVGIDVLLMCQITLIETERIKSDLTWSEEWLGGQFNAMLNYLGSWNPIRRYADSVTRDNMLWLHKIFRESVAYMTLQLAVRMVLAFALFACHMAVHWR